MSKHISYGAFAIALFACGAAASASPIGRIRDVKVDSQQSQSLECADFTLTPQQVRAQLERSIAASMRSVHDYFDWGDCTVRGTLRASYDEWTFEIRQGGVTRIESIHGDVVILVDPRQASH